MWDGQIHVGSQMGTYDSRFSQTDQPAACDHFPRPLDTNRTPIRTGGAGLFGRDGRSAHHKKSICLISPLARYIVSRPTHLLVEPDRHIRGRRDRPPDRRHVWWVVELALGGIPVEFLVRGYTGMHQCPDRSELATGGPHARDSKHPAAAIMDAIGLPSAPAHPRN